MGKSIFPKLLVFGLILALSSLPKESNGQYLDQPMDYAAEGSKSSESSESKSSEADGSKSSEAEGSKSSSESAGSKSSEAEGSKSSESSESESSGSKSSESAEKPIPDPQKKKNRKLNNALRGFLKSSRGKLRKAKNNRSRGKFRKAGRGGSDSSESGSSEENPTPGPNPGPAPGPNPPGPVPGPPGPNPGPPGPPMGRSRRRSARNRVILPGLDAKKERKLLLGTIKDHYKEKAFRKLSKSERFALFDMTTDIGHIVLAMREGYKHLKLHEIRTKLREIPVVGWQLALATTSEVKTKIRTIIKKRRLKEIEKKHKKFMKLGDKEKMKKFKYIVPRSTKLAAGKILEQHIDYNNPKEVANAKKYAKIILKYTSLEGKKWANKEQLINKFPVVGPFVRELISKIRMEMRDKGLQFPVLAKPEKEESEEDDDEYDEDAEEKEDIVTEENQYDDKKVYD